MPAQPALALGGRHGAAPLPPQSMPLFFFGAAHVNGPRAVVAEPQVCEVFAAF